MSNDLFEKNIKLQEEEIEKEKIKLSSLPTDWTVPVSENCNLHCFMCGIGVSQSGHYKIDLPDTFFEDLFRFLPYIKRLTMNGAELFYFKNKDEVEKLLNLAKKYPNLKFGGLTNASLLTKEKAKICLDSFYSLNIFLDTPKPNVYESIRIGAKFDKTIKNIEFLRDLKLSKGRNRNDSPIITISCVVMERTYKDVLDFFQLARDLGAKTVVYNPLRMDVKSEEVKKKIFFMT